MFSSMPDVKANVNNPLVTSQVVAKNYIFMPIIAAVELIVYMVLAILQFYTEIGNKRMNNLWRDYNNYS